MNDLATLSTEYESAFCDYQGIVLNRVSLLFTLSNEFIESKA